MRWKRQYVLKPIRPSGIPSSNDGSREQTLALRSIPKSFSFSARVATKVSLFFFATHDLHTKKERINTATTAPTVAPAIAPEEGPLSALLPGFGKHCTWAQLVQFLTITMQAGASSGQVIQSTSGHGLMHPKSSVSRGIKKLRSRTVLTLIHVKVEISDGTYHLDSRVLLQNSAAATRLLSQARNRATRPWRLECCR